jgi:hypothetical protein
MKKCINSGRNKKIRPGSKHSMTFQFNSIQTRRWCYLVMLILRFTFSSFCYRPITLHNFIWCKRKENNFLSLVHDSIFINSTMVNSISIKLPRTTQQKRTCLHRYNIAISIIMISTDRKVDAYCTSYLGLTNIVEPLNVVWMGVSMCHQAILCHKISTHQIVAISSIDDDANAAIFDNKENLQ